MQITREELNPCTIQLKIASAPEEVEAGYDKAFKQLAKKVKLPGFRPGHAPKGMLEKVIDQESLDEAASEIIIREAYPIALEQEKLEPEPTVRPEVAISALNQAEKKCEFQIKVGLPPKVELGDYKGLKIDSVAPDVTDEEVDRQLEEYRKGRATRETVTDRGVQEGDVCVVNIKITGEPGEGRNFMSVVGQTFPELDAALTGMEAEEMKQLTLSFPKNFQEKDWADSEKACRITVSSISSMKAPELDDEFAKSLHMEGVDQLRERVKTLLVEVKTQAANEAMTDSLLSMLMSQSTVNVPDGMWEVLAERRMQEVAKEQADAGKSMEDYVAERGMTIESFIQEWREQAKMHVQHALLLREVFSQEGMKLEEDDLKRELIAMSREYGTDPATLLDALRKANSLEELHFRAIRRKVSEFLIEHADKKEPAGAKA